MTKEPHLNWIDEYNELTEDKYEHDAEYCEFWGLL